MREKYRDKDGSGKRDRRKRDNGGRKERRKYENVEDNKESARMWELSFRTSKVER